MKSLITIFTALSCIAFACNSNEPATSKTENDSANASMSNSQTSQAQKNKETALASVQGINNHNVMEVLKDAAPDMVDYGDGSYPPIKGLDSCKASLQGFLSAFPDVKGENLMALSDGNHVAVFGDWSGTFKGEMMGMKPTGKSFKAKDVDLFTFNDEGKITEHRNVQSSEGLMRQLGATMKK